MIEIDRKFIRCREVWFDEPWSPAGADLILFYHWNEPMNPAAALTVHSLEIDLAAPEANIWKNFTASTRNQINRASKEETRFQCWTNPGPDVISQFFDFFRQFTHERGLGEGDPEWMRVYSAQKALTLTCASTSDRKTLVWHSYYRGLEWVRQLQSVSLFAAQEDKETRNATARANRFLHWKDMLAFQAAGLRHFDFGGWYAGTDDEKLLRVNAFKEEFGGIRTERHHSMLPVTAKGKLFLQARKYLRRGEGLLHWV